ncbi:MAG: hypothetical protein Q8Q29_11305 [Actinomycetota bacterium]|nr:hypothetical protein [Actinomycetota bacterium]
MSRVRRVLVAFVMVFVSLPVLVGAGGDAARSEHQRIIDFWTPERVAQAIPREFVADPATGRFQPAHHAPGHSGGPGGGGPGGGDSGVVTGASWTGEGTVTGTTGKVLFALGTDAQGNDQYWICSASVIADPVNNSRSIVLTAGHCVYDNEGSGEFASHWMFIPDYDAAPAPLDREGNFCAATAYGCWTASSLVVHAGFASAGGFNDQAVLYDWGFAVVGDGGKTSELVEDVVGAQAYEFAPQAIDGSVTGWAFGYPAQKKYKGNDLIYCSNAIDGDPYNSDDTYRMNQCKLNGGSSGGPWFKAFDAGIGEGTLISVNSYGYLGVTAMHGPMFNSNTQATYSAALTAGGDTTVGSAP